MAALGHAWGPSEERGVFRTTDGGKNWERVLYKSITPAATDLAMDPHHPEVLYANLWQAQRYPHTLSSGGEDSGLWQHRRRRRTWTEITRNKGLPRKRFWARSGWRRPRRSAAACGRLSRPAEERKEGKGPDDGGSTAPTTGVTTWEKLDTEPNLRRRPFYYMHIFADPLDAETVWVLNIQCWKSIDGGKTFFVVPTPHGDNHALWSDPRDPRRRIQGDDGGAFVTFDDGQHWSTIYNQPTAQFYHVTADDASPTMSTAPSRITGRCRLPSMDLEGAITGSAWAEPGGGESGYIAIGRRAAAHGCLAARSATATGMGG